MISAIVAVDNNWGIGFNGELLERIPVDMMNFKMLTENHMVVCGRKTWESIPKRPLSRRLAIVLSNKGFKVEPGAVFINMDHLKVHLDQVKDDPEMEWFVIGGGEVYKQLLPYCDKIYVTKIFKEHDDVDTYFPNLDNSSDWHGHPLHLPQDYKDFLYQFWVYNRIN
jgi:dihydrofolate reductase